MKSTTKAESKHTPTPWHGEWSIIRDESNRIVATTDCDFDAWETKSNSEFIVRAVNAHDDLVAALQFAVDNMHKWTGTTGPGAVEFIEMSRAAIAKAGAV